MKRTGIVVWMLGVLGMVVSGCSSNNGAGLFDSSRDIGKVSLKGSTKFDAQKQEYRIAGGGANIWAAQDAFHFASRQVSGDLKLSTAVTFEGTGGNEHRKGGWMVRQSLDPNAAYVDAVVHGVGLVSLQYRSEAGGQTREIQYPIVKIPAAILLERDGDVFTLSVAKADGEFQPVGSMTVVLHDPVYAGLAVCAHDDKRLDTAIFTKVSMKTLGVIPANQRVLESTLEVLDVTTGERQIVRRAKEHFEAPNWSLDGKTLVYNSRGHLYSLPVAGGEPKMIESGVANQCNNDHGFSPDGKWLGISSSAPGKGSLVYIIPSTGGEARLITQQGPSYWHGWSPDGKTLAFCGERNKELDVYTIPVEGGQETRLTTTVGLDDGPEYTPDGKYIYFNSVRSGLMKIWRMRPDGSQQEQVTTGADSADWFAHISPDGKSLVFVAYDKSVEGHPGNKQITLRLMPLSGGQPKVIAYLFGGQGTMNVPSWSPDSKKIAFVSYRQICE
jgi:Tol biopolymer transport system component